MPLAASDYRAPGWCPGGHLQTVLPARFAPRPKVTYRREILTTPDDDIVAWDWVAPEPADSRAPLLIHFHGLEGGSDSHYAQALMAECVRRGWRGVVAHFRTCGGLMNRKARAYFAGDTADNRWVLETLAKRYPEARRFALGVSLGGNQLSKCLGEIGSDAEGLLDAGISVCAPLDLVAGSERISKGMNVMYANMFLGTLRRKLAKKAELFPDVIRAEDVAGCRTMFDFDECYTSRVHGFRSAMEYWEKCSAKRYLGGVRVPLLLLNARNDPFLPDWSLPTPAEVSPFVTLDFPMEGGHVGFPAGDRLPGHLGYLPERAWRFFESGL